MGAAVTAEPKSKKSKSEVSPAPLRQRDSDFECLEGITGSSVGWPLFLGGGIQGKLIVGAVDDPLEREADRVADQVMRNPLPSRHDTKRGESLQRKCACGGECADCRTQSEEELQAPALIHRRESDSDGGIGEAPSIVHEVLNSPGQPLDLHTRSFFEPRFGRDFGDIRIHTDSKAADSAKAVNAQAFTAGDHIVFGSAGFQPDGNRDRELLAHELTHTVQQRSLSRSANLHSADVHPLRRQATGSTCTSCHQPTTTPFPSPQYPTLQPGQAGSLDVGRGFGVYPGSPSFDLLGPRGFGGLGSDWQWNFDGVWLSTDMQVMRERLRSLVANRGLSGLDEWHYDLHKLHGPCPSCHTSGGRLDEIAGSERRSGSIPYDTILYVEVDAYYQVLREAKDFLATFEKNVKDNTKHTLEANRQQANREATRYGLTGKMRQESVRTEFGRFTFDVPDFQMDPKAPASSGLKTAANILLQRRQKIEDKKRERDTHFHYVTSEYEDAFDDEYWPLNDEVHKMEAEYKELNSYVSDQYPILGRYGEVDADVDALKTIATKGPGIETANLIGAQINETLANIRKSEEGLDHGDINVWRLESMIGLTEQTMGITPHSLEARLIGDKFQQEKPGIFQGIILAVLNIAALLLAGPTGGLSLVVMAGVNTAITISHIQEYQLQKAMAGSALQRAHALSQEDPSLFWLAVEVVGTVFDVATAASAMLKAFRSLAPVVKAAEAAEGAEKLSALKAVRKTASEVGMADKAEGIIARIKGGHAEEDLIKSLSKGEQETEQGLKSLAQTAAKEEELAQKTAQSAELASGGKATVTKTGDIWSCASPCMLLRERYANRLVRDPELEAKVAAIEKRAAEAPAGSEGDSLRKAIAQDAAKLEQEIRTTSLPGDWTSPLKDDPKFAEAVTKRGSVAQELDRHPPGWSGKDEASFRWGKSAEPQPGYTWELKEDGSLIYKRTGYPPGLPARQFNPASGMFQEATEGEQAITRAQFKGAGESKKLAGLTEAEQGKMESLFENRRKLISERDQLEDLEAQGQTLSKQQSERLRRVYFEINEQSRALGENAAEAVMRSKGGVRVYPIGKAYSTAGDFDQVWKVGDEFYIIEAKGGSSGLGTRMISQTERAEQGTRPYFKSIVDNMADKGATQEIRQMGRQLRNAPPDKIKYLLVRAPIGTEKGVPVLADIQVREFALAAQAP